MRYMDITRLPEIRFAHAYSTADYHNTFQMEHELVEVTFIAEGELILRKGGEEWHAGPGDILCLIHDERTDIAAKGYHAHRTVCARVDWVETESENGLVLPPVTPAGEGTEDICRLIDGLIWSPYRLEGTAVRGAAAFLEILSRIDAIGREQSRRIPEGEMLVRRAKRYIYRNLDRPITQREIAAHLGITPQYLCNIFRQAEGKTLIRYVNTAKLKGVEALMEKEHIRLYEAARRFGYQDANYVSGLYKKIFGRNITDRPSRNGEGWADEEKSL